uniref:CCHC-type domain-containing protein n=1 Tax=Cacopsylla melanoneura TaxID=428564 RepID=A0A8D8TTW8_9HEMI
MSETKTISMLRRSQKGWKCKLTMLKNKITEQTNETRDIHFIDYHLRETDEIWGKFCEIHQQIELMIGDDEFDDEVKEYTEIQNIYENIYLKLSREKSQLNSGQSTEYYSARDERRGCVRVNLPELSLPSFSGTITEWLSFSDTFQCLVGQNTSLTDVQRFQYLRSCLQGNALAEIVNLPTTSQNYKLAWNVLKDRYQNTRLIVKGYIENIVDFQFDSQKPSKSLRQMLTSFRNSIHALKSLEYETNALTEQIIIHLIESKLDFYLKERWLEYTETQEPATLKELVCFLEKYCQIFESRSSPEPTTNTNQYSSRHVPDKLSQEFPKSSYISTRSQRQVTCCVCQGNHSIYFCNQFRNLNDSEKFQTVKQLKLCFNCLKAGHHRNRCNSRTSCNTCYSRHHSLLHSTENIKQEPIQIEALLNADEDCDQSNSNPVVLPTAALLVSNQNGQTTQARALLDSGSELNFISRKLADQLKLQKVRNRCGFSGIGDKRTSANYTVKCTVKSRMSEYQKETKFIVMDKITQNVPCASLDKNSVSLCLDDPSLADPNFHIAQGIDVLLGCEVFPEVIKGKSSIQPNGISWLDSEFGLLCSGRSKNIIPQTSCVETPSCGFQRGGVLRKHEGVFS